MQDGLGAQGRGADPRLLPLAVRRQVQPAAREREGPVRLRAGELRRRGRREELLVHDARGQRVQGLLHRLRRRLRHPVTAMKTKMTTTNAFMAFVLAAGAASGCIPGKLTKKSKL